MKKSLILLAGILLACLPGVLMAGINPGNVGLVVVNTDSAFNAADNVYYATGLGTAVQNNNGSVLCVGCHTRNPANLAGATKNVNRNMAGSHFVTYNFYDTSRGGGYGTVADGDGRGQRNASGTHIYMAEAPINWAAAPRYGRLTGTGSGTIDNDIVANAAATITDTAQMICYSCHNLHSNTGTAARLLANGAPALGTTYQAGTYTDNAYLCISCHGDMDAVISAEWQIHPIDNSIETWGATHHHRNSHTVDAVTNAAYKGSATPISVGVTGSLHNMGQMYDIFYNQPTGAGTAIWQMWAVGKGTLGTTTGTTPNPNHAIGFGTPSGRMLASAPDNAWIRPSNHSSATGVGQGVIMCTDCHRGHFGDSSTGATVLIKGGSAAGPSNPVATSMGSGTNPLTAATGREGVWRMFDRGGRAAVFTGNLNPNCLACHR